MALVKTVSKPVFHAAASSGVTQERSEDMENSSGAADLRVVGVPTHGGQYINYTVAGTDFEVTKRYKPPIRPIGRGAYGIVWLESSYEAQGFLISCPYSYDNIAQCSNFKLEFCRQSARRIIESLNHTMCMESIAI